MTVSYQGEGCPWMLSLSADDHWRYFHRPVCSQSNLRTFMRFWQIQYMYTWTCSEDSCQLGKEYLNALIWNFYTISRQNSKSFDISLTFLSVCVCLSVCLILAQAINTKVGTHGRHYAYIDQEVKTSRLQKVKVVLLWRVLLACICMLRYECSGVSNFLIVYLYYTRDTLFSRVTTLSKPSWSDFNHMHSSDLSSTSTTNKTVAIDLNKLVSTFNQLWPK